MGIAILIPVIEILFKGSKNKSSPKLEIEVINVCSETFLFFCACYTYTNIEIDIEGVPPTAWGPPLDSVVTLLLYVPIEDYRYKKSGDPSLHASINRNI